MGQRSMRWPAEHFVTGLTVQCAPSPYTSVAALLHVDPEHPGRFLRPKRLRGSKRPMADAYYQLLYSPLYRQVLNRTLYYTTLMRNCPIAHSFGRKSHSTELLFFDYIHSRNNS